MGVTIPVDLFNPGQVFACYGLLEAAEVLVGDARGGFDWSNPAQAVFHISAAVEDPVAHVLTFFGRAEVVALSPDASLSTSKWKVPDELIDGVVYPNARPDSPATLVTALRHDSKQLLFTHWGDTTIRDNTKFWAGAGGYPGAALLRDALSLVRDCLVEAHDDPFSVSAIQSSSFRLDWRRDYVPLGAGFSLNAHTSYIKARGYPIVEILAAYGLSHARPKNTGNKLSYRYATLAGDHWRLPVLRPVLGCAPLPFLKRTFRIQLGWPGKPGQARCITDVIEEISDEHT